jgi:hypothetical protein
VLLGSETRPGDWIDWLEAAGLSHLVARPRRVFDHFFITPQVVEDGLGLGLGIGPLLLPEIDVASGRIMTPLRQIGFGAPPMSLWRPWMRRRRARSPPWSHGWRRRDRARLGQPDRNAPNSVIPNVRSPRQNGVAARLISRL